MRATGRALALAVLLLSGCSDLGPPDAAATGQADERVARPSDRAEQDEVVVDTTLPLVETTRTYSGQILLRPATGSGPTYVESGDSASFCFYLPATAKSLRGVFSFEPWQQAGLQFRAFEKPYTDVASWGGSSTDPVGYASTLFPASPITLEIPEAVPGKWFTYGGPGTFGAAMTWSYDLTMVTYGAPDDAALQRFEAIDPSCA